MNTFKSILNVIRGKSKVLSIHSRKAENEVFKFLFEYNIRSAIFHWYSGPLQLINKIADAGFFFSINSAMINSKAALIIRPFLPAIKKSCLFQKHSKKIERLLRECNFFRVHHSDLINLNRIKIYHKGRGGFVTMEDGSDVEVSTRKKDDFLKRIAAL